MIHSDRPRFADLIEQLSILYDRELRPGVAEQYWDALQRVHITTVVAAAEKLKLTCRRFPSIAEWHDAARTIDASRRRPRPGASNPETVQMTWPGAATALLVFVRLAGGQIPNDPAARDRLLAAVNDELRPLREDYARPGDVPRELYLSERRRIVSAVLRELRRDRATEATT